MKENTKIVAPKYNMKTKLIIPNRFKHINYENDVIPEIKELVKNFKTTRRGLYLHGDAGTGKTHMAYAICKKISEEGIGVRAFKSFDMLKMIKEDMFRNGDTETNGDRFFRDNNMDEHDHVTFLDGINNFNGLLFIDDLGVEKGTEWGIETLYSIIDKKYEDIIPVIITSNSNLGQLSKDLGDRFSSRISQMCEVFQVTGSDRRLAN